MKMAQESKIQIAYVPFKTFETALDTLNQALPDQIDKSVFRNQSGSTQSMLISALQSLDCMDEQGKKKPVLARLVNPATRKDALREVITDKYKSIIAMAANATSKQFDDAFAEYGVAGDTKKKAKAFFLKAAQVLQIPLSPHIALVSSTAASNGQKQPRNSRAGKKPKPRRLDETDSSKPLDPNLGKLHPVIAAQIADMPPNGEPWDAEDFSSWLHLFRTSIERYYKIAKL
jgi:hypothetical protein